MNKYIILSIIITGLLLSSCSKFLDKEPVSTATDGNFWKNEGEANAAVAGIYALIRKAFNYADGQAFYAYGDLPSDEFNAAAIGDGDIRAAAQMNWSIAIGFSETGRFMMKFRRYDNFYRAIDQANRCLKYVPTVPLEQFTSGDAAQAREALLGEAYFMRAFTYFYMARIWGDVPLVLETTENAVAATDLPRTSQKEILDQCLKDLQAAIVRLSWNNTNSADRAVRANRGAAFALLAHLYAWMGQYAPCAAAADSVITKGGYSLVDRNVFLDIYKGQSPEGIFEIAQSNESEGSGLGSIAFKTLKYPYLATNTGNAIWPLDKSHLTLLFPDTADLRLQKGFAFFNTTDPICIKYSHITYALPNQTGPVARNNIIVFRLADILLLKAEALAATGNYGEAHTILDNIRSRAGVAAWTGTDARLPEAIIEERGRELFLEGHRFYDLVRLARAKGILQFGEKMTAAQFQQGKYYWPLDPLLLNLNARLQQTDYWKDKM